jgi:hypothetical protein
MTSVEDTSVEQSVEATRRMVQEMRSMQKIEKLVEGDAYGASSKSHTAASINGNGHGAASDVLAAGWPRRSISFGQFAIFVCALCGKRQQSLVHLCLNQNQTSLWTGLV